MPRWNAGSETDNPASRKATRLSPVGKAEPSFIDGRSAQLPSARWATSNSFVAVWIAALLLPAQTRPFSRQVRSSLLDDFAVASHEAARRMASSAACLTGA